MVGGCCCFSCCLGISCCMVLPACTFPSSHRRRRKRPCALHVGVCVAGAPGFLVQLTNLSSLSSRVFFRGGFLVTCVIQPASGIIGSMTHGRLRRLDFSLEVSGCSSKTRYDVVFDGVSELYSSGSSGGSSDVGTRYSCLVPGTLQMR